MNRLIRKPENGAACGRNGCFNVCSKVLTVIAGSRKLGIASLIAVLMATMVSAQTYEERDRAFFGAATRLLTSKSDNGERRKFSIGADYAFAFDSKYSGTGVGGRLQYELGSYFRADLVMHYFPSFKSNRYTDISINLHGLIPIDEDWLIYPIFGVGNNALHNNTSWLFGCGFEFPVWKKLSVNIEAKYKYIAQGDSYWLMTSGIKYSF